MKIKKSRLKLLIDNLPDGFAYHKMILDKNDQAIDYVFVDINQTFEKITGLKKENIIGKKVTEVIPDIKKDNFDWISTYGEVALKGQTISFEQYSKPLNRWYEVSAYSDRYGYFACICRDISERKRTTAVLRANEKLFSTLVENSPDIISLFDKNLQRTYCNQVIFQEMGVSPGDLIGRKLRDINLPGGEQENLFQLEELVEKTLSDGRDRIFEQKFLFDNQAKYYLTWIVPIFNNRGNVESILTVSRNITKQKIIELDLKKASETLESKVQARTRQLNKLNAVLASKSDKHKNTAAMLHKEKERLAKTLFSIGEGFISTTANDEIEVFNQGAEQITGWKKEDAISNKLDTVLNIRMENLKGQKEPFDEEITLLNKNGEEKIVNLNVQSIKSENGFFLGKVFIIKDITEKRKIEREKILFQRLSSMGQLAAGIAHEINTPMQYINDNVSFLFEGFCDFKKYIYPLKTKDEQTFIASSMLSREETIRLTFLMKEIPAAIKETQEGIERVTKLVGAIKNFAHPEISKKTAVDINKLILDAVEISRNEWKYVANLSLNFSDQLSEIFGVATELSQALLNIIINASQAIKEALRKEMINFGKITISTSENDQYVHIEVIDNGCGFDDAIRDKAFDLFFTTKEIGSGTGQGLPIAYDIIVNKHRGSLNFTDNPEGGTIFKINIPKNNKS